jgi:hypothetical protein
MPYTAMQRRLALLALLLMVASLFSAAVWFPA